MAKDDAQDKDKYACDDSFYITLGQGFFSVFTASRLDRCSAFFIGTYKIQDRKSHEYSCKNKEGDGCSNRRDSHKGWYKGSDDAAHCVVGAKGSNDPAVVLKGICGVFCKAWCYSSQKEKREHKHYHACCKSSYDEEIAVYCKDQNC